MSNFSVLAFDVIALPAWEGITLHVDCALASAVSTSMQREIYAPSSKTYRSISFLVGYWNKVVACTFRISSVPNRDRNILESMALTVPIVRRE